MNVQDYMKIRVYVAGALNADAVGYIQNVHRMIKTAKMLRSHHYAVYVPANDMLEGIVDGEFTYKDFFDNSQEWLKCSHCIFLTPGWEESKGTKKEIELAKRCGIPVFENISGLNIWRNDFLTLNYLEW